MTYVNNMLRKKIVSCIFKRSHAIARTYSEQKRKESSKFFNYLITKIKAAGPITVADYMKEVLTNPFSGYYMHQDVFGSSGDFITSPEISQIFGEFPDWFQLIGVWLFNQWSVLGKPQPLQLVEFGPGRGTLADDVLRVFSKLGIKEDSFSLHLIEVSPCLSKLQRSKLCSESASGSDVLYENKYNTKYKFPVTWYPDIKAVPQKFSLFLAHEFFDALPIHKFQKTPKGWREILIDLDETSEELKLRYVLSRGPTPSSQLLTDPQEKRNEVEISAESFLLLDDLSTRMREEGGISLIIDYGHCGTKGDTFRSFRRHELHNPLQDPGQADLTADIDFSSFRKFTEGKAISVGPVSQRIFLKNMGIDIRLRKLLESATPELKETLQTGCDMLVNADKMGERFQFLALYPLVLKDFLIKYTPIGFSN